MSTKSDDHSLKIDLLNRQTRANISTMPYTFKEFREEYPDDDACLDALFSLRFGKLTCCPHCGVVEAQFVRIKGRKGYSCVHCRFQLYPMAGTIFHRSTTSLWLWFFAIYLFSVSKNGVSAMELERQLGVTHKTAWRMANRIRSAMKQGNGFLSGVVEADEAYIGGRRRSSNRFSNKTPLLGAVQRGGELRVRVIYESPNSRYITNFINDNVQSGSVLHTDESYLYKRLEKTYDRHSVRHGKFEFVREGDYTNTIEGFWGIFKPYLDGTHRSVSKRWLHLYVNEAVWKYNHRKEQLCPLLISAAAQPVSKVSEIVSVPYKSIIPL
jgi:transposase-like protein